MEAKGKLLVCAPVLLRRAAAYLSQAAGARIVPMAFGGTYQVWRRMFLLRFPRVTVTIGPSLPPVPASGDRQQRQADLEAASVSLMRQIYTMLPPATQAHYDRQARLEFRGEMLFRPNSLALPAGISLDALAELVAKPNLFSPLHRNARLPVRPFVRQGRFVRPRAMKRAADALAGAFDGGDFSGYLEYRLGEVKAAAPGGTELADHFLVVAQGDFNLVSCFRGKLVKEFLGGIPRPRNDAEHRVRRSGTRRGAEDQRGQNKQHKRTSFHPLSLLRIPIMNCFPVVSSHGRNAVYGTRRL